MITECTYDWHLQLDRELSDFGRAVNQLHENMKDQFWKSLNTEQTLAVLTHSENEGLTLCMLRKLFSFARKAETFPIWTHVLTHADRLNRKRIRRIALEHVSMLVRNPQDCLWIIERYPHQYKSVFGSLKRMRAEFKVWQHVGFNIRHHKMTNDMKDLFLNHISESAVSSLDWLSVRSLGFILERPEIIKLATQRFLETVPQERSGIGYNEPWTVLFKNVGREGIIEKPLVKTLIAKSLTFQEILTLLKFSENDVELKKLIISKIMARKNDTGMIRYATALSCVARKDPELRAHLVEEIVKDIEVGQPEMGMERECPAECKGNPRKIAEYAIAEWERRDELVNRRYRQN